MPKAEVKERSGKFGERPERETPLPDAVLRRLYEENPDWDWTIFVDKPLGQLWVVMRAFDTPELERRYAAPIAREVEFENGRPVDA